MTTALAARQPEQHWWSPVVEALTGGPSWSDQASQLRAMQQQHAPLEQRMAMASGLLGGFGGSIKGVGEAAHLPLDLSTEPRMARAREMGFNVDQPVYHGTSKDIAAFDPNQSRTGNGSAFLSEDPSFASSPAYTGSTGGGNVIPAYARAQNPLVLEHLSSDPFVEGNVIHQAKAAGHDAIHVTSDGRHIIFDPANIRSVHAKFDPTHARSADLLASVGGGAVAAALAARQQQP